MEECEPAIKIRSDLRYSNISDSDLGFLVSKAKLVQEESEVKLEFYKIVADICDLDYVDMAKRKTLIQQVEVFINLINLEVLRREKLVQFSYDPFVRDFVDLDLFMAQVNVDPKMFDSLSQKIIH